jgi:hypothetical protein
MLTLLQRLVFGPPPPRTRMTREKVMGLAASAAKAARPDASFTRLSVRHVEGRITWYASTTTIGSGWYVTIDNETGEIGPLKRWGFR